MSDPARQSLEPAQQPAVSLVREGRSEPYRRLAEIFHDVLSEDDPGALLKRIADTLAELVPYEDVHIYEADEARRELRPLLARGKWAKEVMSETFSFGEGITGWAVEHREAVASWPEYQSFQKFLNRSGAISVYRTVCMMFLWPM